VSSQSYHARSWHSFRVSEFDKSMALTRIRMFVDGGIIVHMNQKPK